MQDAIALLLVAGCVAYVARQLFKTVSAGNGKAGSCCSKGCGSAEATPTLAAGPKEHFISSDSLRRRRA